MKTSILTLLLSVPVITGFSQSFNGPVPGLTQEALVKVNNFQDLVPVTYRYLNNWNKSVVYESVEVVASHNGSQGSANNKGSQFSSEQKRLIAQADVGSEITFNITYSHLPAAGEKSMSAKKTHTIDLKIASWPAYQAEYPGGMDKLTTFVRERLTEKLANPWTPVKLPEATVLFTVNEKGEAGNFRLAKSTTNESVDKLLIESMGKMEKWKPAQNSKGENIRQEFKIHLPLNPGGC